MSTTTTNFGWTIPSDTDLVKDGASAMRTLGQAIDTSMADLEGGTTGQILSKASNTDMDFTWTTLPTGGKILQVVQGTTTTQTSISTTTMTDTTITATITPTSATSKILVMISACYNASRSATNAAIGAKVLRGATTIQDFGTANFSQMTATGASFVEFAQIRAQTYLDSPATTSATTYKLQAAPNTTANSANVTFQPQSSPSSIILMEVGA